MITGGGYSRAMRRAIFVAMAAAVAVAGCSSGGGGGSPTSSGGSTINVHGTVLLLDLTSARQAALQGANKRTAGCIGLGPYSDVKPGGSVTIADDAGKTLALAHLAGGYVIDDDATTCSFTFSASVPSAGQFYGITVGRQAPVKVSAAELRDGPEVDVGQG